ncbi:plant virulence effector HPE1-like domain-containing protein [Mycoplana ramosa]|uniref:Plant virulence effector HPE1-like domain-containing protein n=1 Tax=Mycoplana ramosa TaxID=40837 RepID=A0ABW3YSW2_MYCRA
MRSLLLSVAFALLGAPALASSIEPIAAGGKGQGSVQTISCTDCPALKEKKRSKTYVVPDIEPGTQKVEIREVDGERKVFRSEAWLGGSPVVFVSKAPEEVAAGNTEAKGAVAGASAETGNSIDPEATTGALETKSAAVAATAAAGAQKAGSQELDPSRFELRVN